MKPLFLVSLLLGASISSLAQSVGIGTATPNSSAALHINSNTKGLLIPSMNTTQMFDITSPSNGLIVYNTSYGQLYHYNGTKWMPVLNGDYWTRPIANRDRIANPSDSVSIGVITASERLDVNGKIRARETIYSDALVQGAGLYSTGNLTVIGTGLVNGNLITNSDFIIQNATATMQLRTGGVNKGYFQLSNNDVRTGTNAGNTGGRYIIRMNGTNQVYVHDNGYVSIGTDAFAGGYRLSVAGKVICEELKVQLAGNWPDYVFDKNYQLMSLPNLDKYIQTNRHLPNIPAAAAIEKSGLAIGDMQKRMMEKIEELTLYIIDLQKQITELKNSATNKTGVQ